MSMKSPRTQFWSTCTLFDSWKHTSLFAHEVHSVWLYYALQEHARAAYGNELRSTKLMYEQSKTTRNATWQTFYIVMATMHEPDLQSVFMAALFGDKLKYRNSSKQLF